MRICVFADIHGNFEALVKMLDVERGRVDLFLFAGDIFGYFYGQQEIIDKFMDIPGLIAVKGNHENYFLSGRDRGKLLDKYGSSYQLRLTDAQMGYIEALPAYRELVIDKKRIGIFHGGPSDYLEQRVYPDAPIGRDCLERGYDYLVLAHTHYRFLRKAGGTMVINPGSLGQPRDGKGFGYCLLDTEKETCEFKTVDVDVEGLLKQVEERDADRYVYAYLKKKYRWENG